MEGQYDHQESRIARDPGVQQRWDRLEADRYHRPERRDIRQDSPKQTARRQYINHIEADRPTVTNDL
jgi:hypothetical protein